MATIQAESEAGRLPKVPNNLLAHLKELVDLRVRLANANAAYMAAWKAEDTDGIARCRLESEECRRLIVYWANCADELWFCASRLVERLAEVDPRMTPAG